MHHAVNRTHHPRQKRQPDGEHRVAEVRPGEGDHDNGQQQGRDRQQRVKNMVHHRRPQAVSGPGNHAEHQPQQGGAERYHKCAADRWRRTAQQAAQDIATEIVSTEKERHFAVPRP